MSGSIKFLLLLVVALIVALGSLWFVGGKQREFSTAVTIDAPISRVYENLTDMDRAPQWRSEIEEFRALGDGAVEVGSQFETTLHFGGYSDEYLEEILRLKTNELFTTRSTSGRAVVNAVYKLESVDSSHTRLTYKLKMTSRGIYRVLTPFADDSSLKETLESNALALKSMIEAGTTESAESAESNESAESIESSDEQPAEPSTAEDDQEESNATADEDDQPSGGDDDDSGSQS